jgi:hypothetical protein
MLRAKCGCNDAPDELLTRVRELLDGPHPA